MSSETPSNETPEISAEALAAYVPEEEVTEGQDDGAK